jgi:hypothetical protein
MRDQVHDRKRDGSRLLHPSVPKERPLPIILQDGLAVPDRVIGDDPHALVLAFVRTRPSGEAEEEGDIAFGAAFEEVQAGRNALLLEE